MDQPTQEENTNLQQPVQQQPQQTSPAQPIQQTTQPVVTQGTKYAGFWIRFGALFIDGLVLMIPQIIVGIIFRESGFLLQIISLAVTWGYYVVMTHKYQATLGKKAVGIRVISDKSENLNLTQIVIRETIGKLVSGFILGIGYLIAAFTTKKQALHDLIGGTAVVYNDPTKKTPVWIIVLALILPIIIIIIGILAGIVLVSLSSVRDKASDAAAESMLLNIATVANDHKKNSGNFSEFVLPALDEEIPFVKCGGKPFVNMSEDAKEMAIFIKSCEEDDQYFCVDPETESLTKVSSSYANSGATTCE